MAIMNPLTRVDIEGPQGPFLLEILLRNPQDDNPRWVFQQSVKDTQEGLAVASKMSQCYQIRMFLGAAWGYVYLDWSEPDNNDLCSPCWSRKDGEQ